MSTVSTLTFAKQAIEKLGKNPTLVAVLVAAKSFDKQNDTTILMDILKDAAALRGSDSVVAARVLPMIKNAIAIAQASDGIEADLEMLRGIARGTPDEPALEPDPVPEPANTPVGNIRGIQQDMRLRVRGKRKKDDDKKHARIRELSGHHNFNIVKSIRLADMFAIGDNVKSVYRGEIKCTQSELTKRSVVSGKSLLLVADGKHYGRGGAPGFSVTSSEDRKITFGTRSLNVAWRTDLIGATTSKTSSHAMFSNKDGSGANFYAGLKVDKTGDGYLISIYQPTFVSGVHGKRIVTDDGVVWTAFRIQSKTINVTFTLPEKDADSNSTFRCLQSMLKDGEYFDLCFDTWSKRMQSFETMCLTTYQNGCQVKAYTYRVQPQKKP